VTRSRLSGLLRVAVSVGLLALLFWRGGVDLPLVAEHLRSAQPAPLLGAIMLYAILGSVVRGFRWRTLVIALGHRIPVTRATGLFLVGTFFNQLLPTGIGGDVVRTLILGRDGLGRARAASTVIVDRAVGILMLLAAGLAALVVARDRAPPEVVVLLLVAGSAGITGSIVLLSAHRWRERVTELPLVGRVAGLTSIQRFADSFAEYGPAPLAQSAAWSTGFTVLLISANALLARALGIHQAGLVDWVLIVPLVALSSLLPAVGGWGVREWTYTGLLGTLSTPVPADQATAISVLFGGMNLTLAVVGGILTATQGSLAVPGGAGSAAVEKPGAHERSGIDGRGGD